MYKNIYIVSSIGILLLFFGTIIVTFLLNKPQSVLQIPSQIETNTQENIPEPTTSSQSEDVVSPVATAASSIEVNANQTIDEKFLGFFSPNYQQTHQKEFSPEENDLYVVLNKKYGLAAKLILNDSTELYAQGVVAGHTSQDKWWLAAKNSSGKWLVVADGYTYANCSDIKAYNFPTTMVPVCWGNNTLLTR